MLIFERVKGFSNKVLKSAQSLVVDGIFIPKYRNVLAVRENDITGEKILIGISNIVTDAGDEFYAQKIVGATPTNNFGNLYLSTNPWDVGHPVKTSTTDNLPSIITGGEKAPSAGYPLVGDTDPDNTGAGPDVVTWKYEYAKADFADTDVEGGAIAVAGVTSWGAATGTDPVLTAFNISPAFGKSTNDTLKFFVNHTINGV